MSGPDKVVPLGFFAWPTVLDDVVDVVIHDEDCEDTCACVLREQVAAALAIHKPCHTSLEPYACPAGGYDPDTGIPDHEPVCTQCTYDARLIHHPCPTAEALGYTPEGTETP